jgi:hypothetical protein
MSSIFETDCDTYATGLKALLVWRLSPVADTTSGGARDTFMRLTLIPSLEAGRGNDQVRKSGWHPSIHLRSGDRPCIDRTRPSAPAEQFRRVVIGMNKGTVTEIMGKPTGVFTGELVEVFGNGRACKPSGTSEISYYYREKGDSFLLYWNDQGILQCAEARFLYLTID